MKKALSLNNVQVQNKLKNKWVATDSSKTVIDYDISLVKLLNKISDEAKKKVEIIFQKPTDQYIAP